MTIYASQQDMLDRYGQDMVFVSADRDHDQAIDAAAMQKALADASAEIDTYLCIRYSLPLSSTPPVLKRICVDIALYRLSDTAGGLTKEKRQRYEDVLALLDRIAAGKVGLGADVSSDCGEQGSEVRGGEILVESDKRVFTRKGMVGF